MTSVPQTDMLRTVSGAYEQLQILSLCRDSNPSAEALAQLLRNPSCFAGVNSLDDSQKSPLIEGADLNHMATFQSTVKQTFSALHIAIVTGQLDAVKLLLQSGASLHVIDAHGRSPWSLALLPEAPVQDLQSVKLMRKEQDKHSSISAYIRSLADLLEICKSATPSLEAARTCFFDEPDLSRLRITFETPMGYTPLHEASRRGLTDIVDFLLEQKANVNAVTFVTKNSSLVIRDSGEAPLHLAAANGHRQVAELLIRARADIATLTTMGQSALLLCFGADGKHHFEVANVIVEEIVKLREADSNKASSVINCSDAFKITALHAAAAAGALPFVQLLLSVKEIDVNKANIDGHTPFHSAASSGNSFVVRAIAKHGQIDVNKPVKSKLQDSPIHLAAKRGNVDVLIELGILGAHLVKEITDSAGKPIPLQFISNGSAERPFPIDVAQGEARSFLEMAFDLFCLCQREPASSRAVSIKDILAAPRTRRAFLSFRTTSDNTPLHIAVISNNHRAIMDILGCYEKFVDGQPVLGYGVNCHVKNCFGFSPRDLVEKSDFLLTLTSKRFNMELFNLILSDNPTLDEVNQEISSNPASLSYKYCSKDGLFLQLPADVPSIKDGDTCLHIAAARGFETIMCQLIAGGADVNAKNVIGRTPIYVAMASEWESLTKKSDSDRLSARIATMLIDAGASVNDADTFGKHVGETALFRAARLCRHESMKLLISAGADVKVLNLSSGDTVFHVYRKDAHCCMQQLIDAGGLQVINSANAQEGDTPLHVAVKRSVTGQSVALLLKARADPTIANHSGYVPLHEACRYGRIRSIEKLLAFGVDIDAPSNKKSVQKQSAMFQPTSSGTKPRQQLSDVDFKELDFKELAVALCFAQSKLQDHTPFTDTPLHMACRNGQNESVCLLLQHHILPNVLAKNSGGDVPLDASRNLDAHTTRLLLEAMSRHSSSIQSIFLSNTGGKQEDYALFEDNLTFIFDHFPKLMQLTIDNCDGLRSVPPGIKKLTCLVNIDLINCNCLRSLPDEMGHMAKLLEINVKTCPALEFPPIKICKGSKATQKIQAYLKESAGATPLRSVKVLFLGNGRSGKTSVLRMLAKKPLQPGDAGPESTRGVSVNTLSKELKPGFFSSKFNDVPNLMFWDFAGQLEYSAAHEYFMSNRQAVYVIIFNVIEERDCRLQQVKYWLNTVSLRFSRFNRLLLIGTKIDLILDNRDEVISQCSADMRSLVRRCCGDIVQFTDEDIMFVSSLSTFDGHMEKRRALKDRLYTLCKDIFVGDAEYSRCLRFPEQYKKLLQTVQHLEFMFPDMPPIYHAWDTKGHGLGTADIQGMKQLRTLDENLSHQMKEALQVLHDTGHILLAECQQGLCVCFKPQFIADIIAIFADPACIAFESGKLRACATKQSILHLLMENLPSNFRSNECASTIFNFLLSISVVIEIDFSHIAMNSSAELSSHEHLFMVPSALKGRPSFWREVLPQSVMCLRGLRFRSTQKIVTVGRFLRVMSTMVHIPDRMWGCAFVIEVALPPAPANSEGKLPSASLTSVWIFIRLHETRNLVDAVVLGPNIAAINAPEASAAVTDIMHKLRCDSSSRGNLCPFCCASDVYVRCGAAHQFVAAGNTFKASESSGFESSATIPADVQDSAAPSVLAGTLHCSRFHSLSADNVRFGLPLDSLGGNEMPPLYPSASVLRTDKLRTTASIHDASPAAQPETASASTFATETSASSVTLSSSPSSSRARDRLPWQQVTSAGFVVMPDGSGRVLYHSFFVSTLQLEVNDILSGDSMQGLLAACDGGNSAPFYEATISRSRSAALFSSRATASGASTLNESQPLTETLPLKLIYRVGDNIGDRKIVEIYACSRASTVLVDYPTQPSPSPKSLSPSSAFTLDSPHSFSEGDSVMLCVTKDYDGGRCEGILCKVSLVIDNRSVELVRTVPLPACFSQQLPVVNGTLLLPAVDCFGPRDWVLVVYDIEPGKKKSPFCIMAGNSDKLQVLHLMHHECMAREDEGACWREVEDNWSIMLGNESKNYEITAITLFRNDERERLFLQEVEALAEKPRTSSADSAGDTDVDPLKRQVLGHFKEFSQKFSLLPPAENQSINLSVAWWGKSPVAYHGAALNGFWTLPPYLKLDPGFFGEGFYLTRYPRYSDYYMNGLSMTKQTIDQGDILMCYTALGVPYPVTEVPFQPPDFWRIPPSSLCGKPCGPDSPCSNKGHNHHDSHYVTVKLHPESGHFFPCPERQAPDFDEVVVFNPNRILPAAYVSFKRRLRTLLWLTFEEEAQQVHGILGKMKANEDIARDTVDGRTASFHLDQGAKLEDQVDVTVFFSAPSFTRFMHANTHFKDYPSTLFRIICAEQQHDALRLVLQSHSAWAAHPPQILIFEPSASRQRPAIHPRHNERLARDERECFEFASFLE